MTYLFSPFHPVGKIKPSPWKDQSSHSVFRDGMNWLCLLVDSSGNTNGWFKTGTWLLGCWMQQRWLLCNSHLIESLQTSAPDQSLLDLIQGLMDMKSSTWGQISNTSHLLLFLSLNKQVYPPGTPHSHQKCLHPWQS